MDRLLCHRRGTATIEFALILPIMVLLLLGLADTVRRTLAEMDADAAAAAGAMHALRHGFDGPRIAAAITAADPRARILAVRLLDCGSSVPSSRRSAASRPASRRRLHPASSQPVACGLLPAGRYASVTTGRALSSLFNPVAVGGPTATAIVRLASLPPASPGRARLRSPSPRGRR